MLVNLANEDIALLRDCIKKARYQLENTAYDCDPAVHLVQYEQRREMRLRMDEVDSKLKAAFE